MTVEIIVTQTIHHTRFSFLVNGVSDLDDVSGKNKTLSKPRPTINTFTQPYHKRHTVYDGGLRLPRMVGDTNEDSPLQYFML